jgi:hypothetical protein
MSRSAAGPPSECLQERAPLSEGPLWVINRVCRPRAQRPTSTWPRTSSHWANAADGERGLIGKQRSPAIPRRQGGQIDRRVESSSRSAGPGMVVFCPAYALLSMLPKGVL